MKEKDQWEFQLVKHCNISSRTNKKEKQSTAKTFIYVIFLPSVVPCYIYMWRRLTACTQKQMFRYHCSVVWFFLCTLTKWKRRLPLLYQSKRRGKKRTVVIFPEWYHARCFSALLWKWMLLSKWVCSKGTFQENFQKVSLTASETSMLSLSTLKAGLSTLCISKENQFQVTL